MLIISRPFITRTFYYLLVHCPTRVNALCILDLVLLFVLFRVQLDSWMWLQCCHKTQLCWGLFPLTCQVLCSLERDCWYQSAVCLERDKRPSCKVCVFRVMKNHSTFAFIFWNDVAGRKAAQSQGCAQWYQSTLVGSTCLLNGLLSEIMKLLYPVTQPWGVHQESSYTLSTQPYLLYLHHELMLLCLTLVLSPKHKLCVQH